MELFNVQVAQAEARIGSGSNPVKKPEGGAAREAAQDFEAMMIGEMLKSMRKANEVLAEDGLLNTREQSFWQDYQDSELAISLSRGRGLGLADQLLEQIERLQS